MLALLCWLKLVQPGVLSDNRLAWRGLQLRVMLSPPRALVFNVVISPISLFAALSLSLLFSFFRAIDLRTLPRFCPHLVRTVSDFISKIAGNDEFKRNDFEKAALLYDKVAALIGSSFIDA